MASLKLSHIYKVYDNGHKAVNDFCIDIEDKEFIVFVGPSGCGKSTTLRMIAGLENITAGDLFIGDTLVNDMEPKDRDIAMVFQSYALYPHMSVYENMAFGLRNRHMPEEEIKQRVLEAARMLDITDYLDRKPKAMSGGQRQRVALGRALVRNPKVFLLDEPLSNLDAKLRATMRTEITKLHKKLETTFIYVTHDQIEAMTMGTRIVVMKLGYVQQIDTPMNLYNKPYNKFVAGFIGTPQMNFFDVTLNRLNKKDVEVKFIDGSAIKIPYANVAKAHDSYIHGDVSVILGIRPEHIEIAEKETGLACVVNAVEHLGNESIVYGTIGKAEEEFTMKDEGRNIIVKISHDTDVKVGDKIHLQINPDKLHLFDHETEVTLINEVPAYSPFAAKISKGQMEMFGGKAILPPTLAAKLGDAKEAVMEIPPFAVVPGKDFTLKVEAVEKVGKQRLAHLVAGDRYLFALVSDKVKEGQDYSFSLRNDKLKVLVDGQVVAEPIGEEEKLIGTFKKHEINRKEIEFFYDIADVKILAPVEAGYKINAVEGEKCYKKTYRYVFNRKNVALAAEGLSAEVKEILDYGNQRYARLDVQGQEILIEVDGEFASTEVKLEIAGENIEVWQQESDFRIC
ncbi:MAG: sn-glycerol-3-phosphate ABC transporter ATP-binding protein UgpC [Bacilli bacterium]|nr:sn-glycerol-3-phosphate ABC transporter ATP-binding protein UgpC [Bacilli bacterium]